MNMAMRFVKVTSILLALISFCASANAQIQIVDGDAECALKVVGEIASGDIGVLSEAFALRGIGTSTDGSFEDAVAAKPLCLDSPGGSYYEGIEIARLVNEMGIPTRVGDADRCFSACALIFMAGRAQGTENDGPRRTMHINAGLGFHAPYFALESSETFSSQQVNGTVDVYREMVLLMVQFGRKKSIFSHAPVLAPSLIEAVFSRGPSEIEYLDSINEAMLWGVNLEGFAEKHAKVYAFLKAKEDKWKSKWPWKNIGDYYIISLRKK